MWGVCVCVYIYIYIYTQCTLKHKKEWNNAICNNTDGPRDDHTKSSKSDRERQISYDSTYTEYKKIYKWTYLQNRNRLTNIEKNLWSPKGKEKKAGVWDEKIHTNMHKIDKQQGPTV